MTRTLGNGVTVAQQTMDLLSRFESSSQFSLPAPRHVSENRRSQSRRYDPVIVNFCRVSRRRCLRAVLSRQCAVNAGWSILPCYRAAQTCLKCHHFTSDEQEVGPFGGPVLPRRRISRPGSPGVYFAGLRAAQGLARHEAYLRGYPARVARRSWSRGSDVIYGWLVAGRARNARQRHHRRDPATYVRKPKAIASDDNGRYVVAWSGSGARATPTAFTLGFTTPQARWLAHSASTASPAARRSNPPSRWTTPATSSVVSSSNGQDGSGWGRLRPAIQRGRRRPGGGIPRKHCDCRQSIPASVAADFNGDLVITWTPAEHRRHRYGHRRPAATTPPAWRRRRRNRRQRLHRRQPGLQPRRHDERATSRSSGRATMSRRAASASSSIGLPPPALDRHLGRRQHNHQRLSRAPAIGMNVGAS